MVPLLPCYFASLLLLNSLQLAPRCKAPQPFPTNDPFFALWCVPMGRGSQITSRNRFLPFSAFQWQEIGLLSDHFLSKIALRSFSLQRVPMARDRSQKMLSVVHSNGERSIAKITHKIMRSIGRISLKNCSEITFCRSVTSSVGKGHDSSLYCKLDRHERSLCEI